MAVAHLHAHSDHSFGRGTASPDALCSAAARRGVEALALTDLEGLYGAPAFAAAARRHGIHPVFGASFADPAVPRSAAAGRAVVLARDPVGYAELCALVTRRHEASTRSLERELERLSEHVWVLSPDLALLKSVARVRGPRFIAAELRAGARWMRLAEAAEDAGIPTVGSAVVQLADAADRRFQRLLLAVHGRQAFARVRPEDLAAERGWVLDEGATRAAFSRWPEAAARALEVARDCRVGSLAELVGAHAEDDVRMSVERLRSATLEGLRRRGEPDSPRLREVERELVVLADGGRAEAMLTAADLAEHGRRSGLRVVALPEAAGSTVAWSLGLVPLPPEASGVSFEALCNELSGDGLQLDLRVPEAGRSRLIDRLVEQVGAERVATPGAFRRWSARDAVRDVARSAALPPSECEHVLGLLPADWKGEGPEELLARHPRLQGAGLDEAPWDRILRAAARLAGRPSGLEPGTGVVVMPGDVARRAPRQTVGGQPCLQWDAASCRQLGAFVLALPSEPSADLLLRADPSPRQAQLPSLVPLLRRAAAGDVLGCASLEEPAVRRRLMKAQPADVEQLLSAVAGVPPAAFAETRLLDAADRAGLDEREADWLGRLLRSPEGVVRRGKLRRRLVDGLRAGGGSVAAAAELWDRLVAEVPAAPRRAEVLAECLAGLDLLALRDRRPAAFYGALLATGVSAWSLAAVAAQARRAGLVLRPPCVQEGPLDTVGEGDAVRLGLQQVRGVRAELCLMVLAERRERGPFADLPDFLERVPGTVDEVDALIAAGAFDRLRGPRSRAGLLALHRHLRPYRTRPRSGTRRRAQEPPPPDEGQVETIAARASRLRSELDALGFCLDGHPVETVAAELPPGARDALLGPIRDGEHEQHLGWLVSGALHGRPPPDLCWWLGFHTPAGPLDVAVPDRVVRGGPPPSAEPAAWWIRGRVREEGGLRWIEAEELAPAGLRGEWAKTA